MPEPAHPIRFDCFMENALYGPRGYYTSERQIFGARGDFTTSPKLSLIFAKAIAQWVIEAWEFFGKKLPLIELGPGDGSLALGIRKAFPFWQAPFLSYHLVEKSPALRARQQDRLGKKHRWHDSLEAALDFHNGEALVISNEVIDAFAVRIFKKNDVGWDELHLAGNEEIWMPTEKLPDSTQFAHDWPIGQRLEIHDDARAFLHEQLAPMTRGDLLTIDYGGSAEFLYHRRPRGNLRAYLLHQIIDPPAAYQNPGHQDLTTDVCFDDLIHWLTPKGFKTITLQSQHDFLEPHAENTLQDIYLTHPDGPGAAFQVLHQRLR